MGWAPSKKLGARDYWYGSGPQQRPSIGMWTNAMARLLDDGNPNAAAMPFRDDGNPSAAGYPRSPWYSLDSPPRHHSVAESRKTLLSPSGVGTDDYWYGGGPLPQRGGTGTWTNAMARNLGVRSQTPIQVVPGQIVEAYAIDFDYAGPAKRLVAGWAIKPQAPGIWDQGTNWNSGGSAIIGGYSFSMPIAVPASANFAHVSKQISIQIVVPAPGKYQLRDGQSGWINAGNATTWVWLTDYDWAVQQTGRDPPSDDAVEMDDNANTHLFLIDSPNAPVLNISGNSGAQNLAVSARAR